MEPLPEVRAAAERLRSLTDVDLVKGLEALAALAVALVPSCVGLSLTVVLDGEPYTLTTTSDRVTPLDAVQYLEGGPCLESLEAQEEVSVPDVLDERRWQRYCRAAAEVGVRSSLSMPIADAERQTPGAINIYASDPYAFDGNRELIAAAFQVPVETLVANADLGFMTRDLARELPQRLEAKATVDRAVGVLMALHGWDAGDARARLHHAASKAKAPVENVAGVVISLHES